MSRSKKSNAGSRIEALAEALNALNARPLEVVLTHLGPFPEGTRLERRLINTVVATDRTTVIKVYREEPVLDDAAICGESRDDEPAPKILNGPFLSNLRHTHPTQ